jgi:hypothetical protein
MGRVADFSGVSDYKTIAAGQYEVEVVSFEWKDPKGTPSPDKVNPATGKAYQYANVKLTVTDETDDAGEKVAGHVLFDKFSESPKSLFVWKRAAIAFGEDPELFDNAVDLDVVIGNMVGRRAIATVAVEEFKRDDGTAGKSNKISTYASVEQPTSTSASRR